MLPTLPRVTFEYAAFDFEELEEGGEDLFIRLTCKLANQLDGLDVTDVRVGETIELPDASGALLIAEGWAEETSGVAAPDATGGENRQSAVNE